MRARAWFSVSHESRPRRICEQQGSQRRCALRNVTTWHQRGSNAMSKVALVTGASSGMGHEAAILLAKFIRRYGLAAHRGAGSQPARHGVRA